MIDIIKSGQGKAPKKGVIEFMDAHKIKTEKFWEK